MSHAWGVLPGEVRRQLRAREYENLRNLRLRLLGQREFPLRLNLRPPSEAQALADLGRLRQFVTEWREYTLAGQVEWQIRQYPKLGPQRLPVRLEIADLATLLAVIGDDAVARSYHWQHLMQPLLSWDARLYPALVQQLESLEALSPDDQQLLLSALQQLQPGMGSGDYLRALPLRDVDTKFIQRHARLLQSLLDQLHSGAVSQAGGLLPWLNCTANPCNWLWVRPLCPSTQAALGGLPLLQLPSDYLQQHALPGQAILVVENLESGLGLPYLDDTVAVFGGGRNVSWMSATWLPARAVAYWGDIDTWGLQILSDARSRCPHLSPVMMDRATLDRFGERRVAERVSASEMPQVLTPDEQELWQDLLELPPNANRLEQERLPAAYIQEYLQIWANCTGRTTHVSKTET